MPPRLILMTLGHFAIDSHPAVLFALLPVFMAKLHLSYGLAGLLTTSMLTVSSVAQPIFGYASDRATRFPAAALGLAVGALAVGLTGFAGTYEVLLALVLVSGLGSACFHPQAVAEAGRAGRKAPGHAIAVFFTGGSSGTAAMSLAIVPLVAALGLHATLLAALPGLSMACLMWRHRGDDLAGGNAGPGLTTRAAVLPLVLLVVISILRSAVMAGYLSFVPSLVVERGGNLELASAGLAAFLFSGAAGALLGGLWSQRVGAELVTLVSLLGALACLLPVPWLRLELLVPWLPVAGVLLFASEAQVTTSAQRLLPSMPGVASSLMMGVGLGLGNLGGVATGLAADRAGLQAALAVLPLLLLGAVGAAGLFLRLARVARSEPEAAAGVGIADGRSASQDER